MKKRMSIKEIHEVGNIIEELVEEYDIGYMEACLKYCSDNDVEIELVGEIIQKNVDIKAKIEYEALELNFLKI